MSRQRGGSTPPTPTPRPIDYRRENTERLRDMIALAMAQTKRAARRAPEPAGSLLREAYAALAIALMEIDR